MSAEPRADELTSANYTNARRAYERGRLLGSGRHGLLLAALFATLGGLAVGRSACAWTLVVLATWVFVEWRGGALLAGARRGIVGGVVCLLLPWSILRMLQARCRHDGGLLLHDARHVPRRGRSARRRAVGIPPRSAPGRRMETAAGMALVMTSAATLKCSELFIGETVGLLGGLIAGVAAASLVRLVLDRRGLRPECGVSRPRFGSTAGRAQCQVFEILPAGASCAGAPGLSDADPKVSTTADGGRPTGRWEQHASRCPCQHRSPGGTGCARASSPPGQDATGIGPNGEPCTLPGDATIKISGAGGKRGASVSAQCADRSADKTVYCSCRCANADGRSDDGAPYCSCPTGAATPAERAGSERPSHSPNAIARCSHGALPTRASSLLAFARGRRRTPATTSVQAPVHRDLFRQPAARDAGAADEEKPEDAE